MWSRIELYAGKLPPDRGSFNGIERFRKLRRGIMDVYGVEYANLDVALVFDAGTDDLVGYLSPRATLKTIQVNEPLKNINLELER